ncbi:MAG: hypothetical protein HY315_03180 [Acidobacteria bacterium]|nr:hypothetical protein [Acidobacteriota bacterium]
MKGINKFLFMSSLVLLVATLATATSWAQVPFNDTGDFGGGAWLANRTRFLDNGSRIFPSGSVHNPGSQLLYLVDFGARTLTADKRPTNFLTVTNVHSTQAVTVHVRYLSSRNCADILDFLVVLTPNDVWQFDPFNIVIPKPDGTSTNISASSQLLDASKASIYGDGRFLIFISASGAFDPFPLTTAGTFNATVTTSPTAGLQPPWPDFFGRQVANILFPNSVYTANLEIGGSTALTGFDGVGDGLGGQKTANRVLNILTAKNISFNYLIGSQTLATAPLTDGSRRSFGLAAWARPAVVFDRSAKSAATFDLGGGSVGNGIVTFNSISYDRDGDGPEADFRVILAGQESVPDAVPDVSPDTSPSTTSTITNDNFLRSEIQNGFYVPFLTSSISAVGASTTVASRIGWRVKGGALAWDRVFPTDEAEVTGASPDRQIVNMISVEDDYNGSKNTTNRADDRAAGFWQAHTLVATAVYDNTEAPLSQVVPDVIISPPPATALTNRLAVVCINVLLSDDSFTLGTDFGDLSLRDLYNLTPSSSTRTVQQHLAGPVADPPQEGLPGIADGTDLAAGWMRFNRLRQELTGTALTDESPRISCSTIDCTSSGSQMVVGSPTSGQTQVPPYNVTVSRNSADQFSTSTTNSPRQHSFVWLGRYNIQFRELGAAYWLHNVSDEDTGIGNRIPAAQTTEGGESTKP